MRWIVSGAISGAIAATTPLWGELADRYSWHLRTPAGLAGERGDWGEVVFYMVFLAVGGAVAGAVAGAVVSWLRGRRVQAR